jgi:hypothetical protein
MAEMRGSSQKQLAFFNTYCGCDKVYLEPYQVMAEVPADRLEKLIACS